MGYFRTSEKIIAAKPAKTSGWGRSGHWGAKALVQKRENRGASSHSGAGQLKAARPNLPVIQAASRSGSLADNTLSGAASSIQNPMLDEHHKGVTANKSSKGFIAKEVDAFYNGSGVGGWRPDNWNFLVGKTRIDFVMGHLWNEKLGGEGKKGNLTPITQSMNAQMYHGHEKFLQQWTEDDQFGYNYEADVAYSSNGNAATAIWNDYTGWKLNLNKFHNQHGGSKAPFQDYVKETVPNSLKVKAQLLYDNNDGTVRKYPEQTINYTHSMPVASKDTALVDNSGGPFVQENKKAVSHSNHKGVTAKKASKGYEMKNAYKTYKGSGVGGWRPDNWDYLVGKTVLPFVMGHMFNQKLGGKGQEGNLTPISSSLNSQMYHGHEKQLQSWVGKSARHGYNYSIEGAFSNAGVAANSLWGNFRNQRDNLNQYYRQPNSEDDFKGWIKDTVPDAIRVKVNLLENDGTGNDHYFVYPQQQIVYTHFP